jgi:hypothetical protein
LGRPTEIKSAVFVDCTEKLAEKGIETVTEVELSKAKGQRRIGDAIIKDLKDSGALENASQNRTDFGAEFDECTQKLAERGVEYDGKPYDSEIISGGEPRDTNFSG